MKKRPYWLIGVAAVAVVAIGAFVVFKPGYDPATGAVAYSLPTFAQRPAVVVQTAIKEPQKSSDIVKTTDNRTVYRETTQIDIDPIVEIGKMKASVDSTKQVIAEQVSAIRESLSENAKKQKESFDALVAKLREEVKTQVASASTPTASPSAAQEAQAPAPQAPTTSAATQVAQTDGNVGIVVPKGFHLTTTLDEANQAKMRRCKTTLVLDRESSRCYMQGTTRICPFKCQAQN